MLIAHESASDLEFAPRHSATWGLGVQQGEIAEEQRTDYGIGQEKGAKGDQEYDTKLEPRWARLP